MPNFVRFLYFSWWWIQEGISKAKTVFSIKIEGNQNVPSQQTFISEVIGLGFPKS